MSRLPIDYTDLVKNHQTVFDEDELLEIEMKGAILEFEECLDFLMIDIDDLTPEALRIAKKVHKRGRMKAVYDAYTKLSGKQGAELLLNKLATTFATPPEDQASLGPSFVFNAFVDPVVPENSNSDSSSDK